MKTKAKVTSLDRLEMLGKIHTRIICGLILLVIMLIPVGIINNYTRIPLTAMSVDAAMNVVKGNSTTVEAMAVQNVASNTMLAAFWVSTGLWVLIFCFWITQIIKYIIVANESKTKPK
jgi:hypothetical protein